MAYLRFLDSKELIRCKVIPESEHLVLLSFPGDIVVNISGFDLFLDEKGEVNIGGDSYHGFTTIYRNDDYTTNFHGYQLSDDGSVYVEPVVPEPEPSHEPTAEELEEQERQQKISDISNQIWIKKQELSDTDYIIVKLYEHALVGKECEDYDLDELHERRQTLRDEINGLTQELIELESV